MPTVSHARAMVAGAVLTLCACGGEPTRPSASQQFAHYDSLAQAAAASGEFSRSQALSRIAMAYRSGISPATVTVLDSGVARPYSAAVMRYVTSGTPPAPSPNGTELWDLLFWQEPDGARFIYASGHADSVSFALDMLGGSLLHFGQISWGAPGRVKVGAGGYVLLALRDTSGVCTFVRPTATCTFATFTTSLAAVVKPLTTQGGLIFVDDSAPPHPLTATSLVLPGSNSISVLGSP